MFSIRSHDGVNTHYSNLQGRILFLFYRGQVKIIKETRKVLEEKIRKTVDKVGPELYKNFDKMKLIMRNPKIAK